MYPVLFKFGRFEIHAYGLLLAISFLIGIYWGMHRAEKRGLNRNHVMDLSLIIVLSAIVGSRLMYVLTHIDEFRGHWLDAISPFQSSGSIGIAGLTMLGGVVLVLISIVIYARMKKLDLLKLCDALAPSFALGIALTRIGCFFNGCCFGRTCDLPWGIKFPLSSAAGSIMHSAHVHPTQLYSSLYALLILGIILVLDRKRHFDGFIMSVFFMLYGISRFLVDFVRYYDPSQQISFVGISLTFNQIISLFMFLFGLFACLKLRKRTDSIKIQKDE